MQSKLAVTNETELISVLRAFVTEACKGRDDSHNQVHMAAVCRDALWILDRELDPTTLNYAQIRKLTIVVAWLHDVFDHKYDRNGSLKAWCRAFLREVLGLTDEETTLIMNIIDRISFSKEEAAIKAGCPPDFEALFGEYAIVRNIVSDADKNQAIGEIGIDRCAQYTLEHHEGIDSARLETEIRTHFDEKLGRLHTEFIRTQAGKQLTKPNHDRMVEILDDLPTYLAKRGLHVSATH